MDPQILDVIATATDAIVTKMSPADCHKALVQSGKVPKALEFFKKHDAASVFSIFTDAVKSPTVPEAQKQTLLKLSNLATTGGALPWLQEFLKLCAAS